MNINTYMLIGLISITVFIIVFAITKDILHYQKRIKKAKRKKLSIEKIKHERDQRIALWTLAIAVPIILVLLFGLLVARLGGLM